MRLHNVDDEAESATAGKAAERLAFFSDAVVAIAITLLAIELPVPTGEASEEIVASFQAISDEYVTFLISFAVIASHWMAHHRLFRYVHRADGIVLRLNLLWLLLVVITPFLTKVINEGEINIVRFSAYAVAQAVQVLTFAAMAGIIARRGWLAKDAPEAFRRRGYLHGLVLAAGFLLSVPAFLLVGSWAYLLWIVLPVSAGWVSQWGRQFRTG